MKVKNLLILVLIGMIGVAFLSYPANAESGSITITTNSFLQYSFTGGGVENPDFTKININTSNYNQIEQIFINTSGTGVDYATNGKSTDFTITGCGSGSGTASYSKTSTAMAWYFTYPSTFNCNPIVLSYTTNIFNDVSASAGYSFETANYGSSISITKPVFISSATGKSFTQTCSAGCTVPHPFAYSVILDTNVQNNYAITYQSGTNQLFTTAIDKTPTTVNTQVIIENATGNIINYSIQGDSGFNNNAFTVTNIYRNGIALNMSIASGQYTRTIVNSSGVGLPPGNGSAGTNPTNVTKPASGANLGFDKSSYFVGDNVNISWYYSDDAWNSISQKKLKLYLNDIPINTGNAFCDGCIDTPTQSGYYIYQATKSGTLKVNAELGTIFIDVIGTASVSILPPGTSWIALNKTSSYAKQPVNVTYHIGYSVASYPAAAIEIDTVEQSTGNVIDSVFPTVFPDGNILIGVIHPIPAGTYAIKLYDAVKNQYLDTKYLTVILVPSVIPVAGITTSSITTDKSSYFYNDYLQIDFKVDDVNYSNYSIRGEVLNINQSIVTKRIYAPFSDQVGTFTTVVNIDKNQKCEKNLNCWFDVGNNSVQIVAYNSTNSFTIAYANFTVTATTPDGYGLQISTQSPKKGEQFTITTIVPALHTGKLTIMDSGYATNFSFGIVPVPAGTTTTPYTIFRVNSQGFGYYDVILYGDDGLIKGKIPITISSPLVVPTIPGQTGSWTPTQQDISKTCSWLDNWVQLVFSEQGINDITRFMFSLLIISIVMIMALIASDKNFGVSIIIGFMPYAYFVYLSQSTPCGTYMPTWTIVFIALIIAVKQRWF